MEEKTYRLKLGESGLRNTKPRKLVFEILLSQGHRPISTKELILKCTDRADRATIYRSIESLEKAGIIHKIYQGWKYKLELSEEFHGHHHHITCNVCGQVSILDESDNLEVTLSTAASKAGFEMTRHNLELQGICQSCKDSKLSRKI